MKHDVRVYALVAAIFLAAWTAAWFVFIRPLLRRYAATAGVVTRLEAAEGNLRKKVEIWLEAKKTLVLAFFTSAFAAGKAATDQATSVAAHAAATMSNLTPDAFVPLQDRSLWSAFFGDIWTLHIVAALGILTAFLTLKGKVLAAEIVPAQTVAAQPLPAQTAKG